MVSQGHLDRNNRQGRRNRWRVEEGFETAKNELGLDHNETRSWHGWHRGGYENGINLLIRL